MQMSADLVAPEASSWACLPAVSSYDLSLSHSLLSLFLEGTLVMLDEGPTHPYDSLNCLFKALSPDISPSHLGIRGFNVGIGGVTI